jgi:hypothetical protein
MAVSAHIAAVVCAAPEEGVPPEWRRAFDGLGVQITRTLATANPSAGALAKAARDRGLDHLCVLNADADGVPQRTRNVVLADQVTLDSILFRYVYEALVDAFGSTCRLSCESESCSS